MGMTIVDFIQVIKEKLASIKNGKRLHEMSGGIIFRLFPEKVTYE